MRRLGHPFLRVDPSGASNSAAKKSSEPMNSRVPWGVRGVRPSVRDAARDAARRQGMSLGEWLNAAIAESAHDAYAPDDDGGYDAPRERAPAPARTQAPYHDTDHQRSPISDIHARLDAITRQIDRISPRREAPRPAAPRPAARAPEPAMREARESGNALARQLGEAISRIDRQLDQLNAGAQQAAAPAPMPAPAPANAPQAAPQNEFDRMVAEFGARRGELNGRPGQATTRPPGTTAAAKMPPPSQPPIDLASLERQLQHITGRIESLPQAGPIDAAIASFREELAEIRQALTEALPRKAVESIEHEIRALAHRIDNSRQGGADQAALANIERALGDILGIVRTLTPAEQLAGYDNAIRALSDKIDDIVRDTRDPGAIDQLEAAIATLKDIASRVASNEMLGQLRHDIQLLAEKVGAMPMASDESVSMLGALEQRIAVLTEALQTRAPSLAPDLTRMEGAMEALSARIDQMQPQGAPETDPAAYLRLEERIGALISRIDESGDQSARFDEIERNLGAILTEIERQRETLESATHQGTSGADAQIGEAIRREISDLRFTQSEAERRMQDSMESVHATLGHVVDRLAQIEGDLRQRASAPVNTTPMMAADIAPPIMPADPIAPPAPAPAPRAAAEIEMPAKAPAPPAAAKAKPDVPRPALSNPAREQAPPIVPAQMHFAPAAETIASALDDKPALSADAADAEADAGPRKQKPPMAGPRRPIDDSLPPDFPIEPGTRGAARPQASAAERIAASQADIEMPPGEASSTVSTANPASFIAAARRAAKNAAGQASARATTRSAPLPGAAALNDTGARAKSTFSNKLRQLLVGASVVVIVLGTLRVGMNILSGGDEPAEPPQAADKASAIPMPLDTKSLADKSFGARDVAAAPDLIDRPSIIAPPAKDNVASPPAGFLAVPTPAPEPAARDDQHSAAEPQDDVTGSIAKTKMAAIAPAQTDTDAADAADAAETYTLAPFEGTLPEGIGNAALREAAIRGNAAAAYEIAARYAEGKGVGASYADAAIWYQRAAEGGIVPAMFRSGSVYEKGLGVKKDLAKARDYYASAAEAGNAKAMHNLAVLFADGGGKGPDYANAAKWFRKAADHGLADSQYNLGILYARGIGVPQNLAESYKWFALAAAQGDTDAGRKRDDVEKRLDPASLTAARLAVQTFTAQVQPDEALNVSGLRAEWGASTSTAPKSAKGKSATQMPAKRTSTAAKAKPGKSARAATARPALAPPLQLTAGR